MEETDFEQIADVELNKLIEALIACSDDIDPDLESGVLSISFDDGAKYVVNSHRAARQIWMAAERSAWHFDYDADKGQWIAANNGDELWQAVSRVVSNKIGTEITLSG